MKTPTLILLVFYFAIGNLLGQDTITGGTVSGTWTQAHSPYIITGAIMVVNGTWVHRLTRSSCSGKILLQFVTSYKFSYRNFYLYIKRKILPEFFVILDQ